MVRLVWFPGYMDWERRKYTWEIRGQNADVRGARSFAQCVSLVKYFIHSLHTEAKVLASSGLQSAAIFLAATHKRVGLVAN